MAGRLVYRAMKSASDGLPELDASSRTLGARPGVDIPVEADGYVRPGAGGMSVSPGSPLNLPRSRRPPEFDGYGRDAVYGLDRSALGRQLRYRPDPDDPDKHGFVEPSRRMTFEYYQRAIWSTRDGWIKVGA